MPLWSRAQAKLEFSEDTISYLRNEGFKNVHWSPVLNHIECKINEKHPLTYLEENGEKLLCNTDKRKITSEIDNGTV